MRYNIFLDSFSGALADLKTKQRTEENALAILAEHPRVSTWDMSENRWLCGLIDGLKQNGLIVEQTEPYPWHRFALTDKGRAKLRPNAKLSDTGR